MSDTEKIEELRAELLLARQTAAEGMRERAAAWCENEIIIAREEAKEDGDHGAGFMMALKYAAEQIRALPVE